MDRFTALSDPRNSFLHWAYTPILAGVPTPRFAIHIPAYPTLSEWSEEIGVGANNTPGWILNLVCQADNIGGFPLIMRTDQAAAKHNFAETCFVRQADDICRNLNFMLLQHRGLPGTPAPIAVILREYLPPASINVNGEEVKPFRAFGRAARLPIGAERRYFVRDGAVECHHPYWPEQAIRDVEPQATNWQERLRLFNHEGGEEVTLLTEYATRLGKLLPGYWSMDFMFNEQGWMFVDAALGECSAHLPCPFNLSGK